MVIIIKIKDTILISIMMVVIMEDGYLEEQYNNMCV